MVLGRLDWESLSTYSLLCFMQPSNRIFTFTYPTPSLLFTSVDMMIMWRADFDHVFLLFMTPTVHYYPLIYFYTHVLALSL